MGKSPSRLGILALSAAAATLLLSSALAASASGAVEIGQASPADPVDCVTVGNLVQASTAAASPSYSAPTSGVITAWSHRGDNAAPGSGRLQIWRFAGGANFTLVGGSTSQAFVAGVKSVFFTRIPVITGDRVGLRGAETTTGCFHGGLSGDVIAGDTGSDPAPGVTRTFVTAATSTLLNVEATLEADADGDTFGDETQDGCPGQAGTVNGCPPATPAAQTPLTQTPAPPKKCKKGQKLRKGKCVKKKRKK